jgi:hypothetical protein
MAPFPAIPRVLELGQTTLDFSGSSEAWQACSTYSQSQQQQEEAAAAAGGSSSSRGKQQQQGEAAAAGEATSTGTVKDAFPKP